MTDGRAAENRRLGGLASLQRLTPRDFLAALLRDQTPPALLAKNVFQRGGREAESELTGELMFDNGNVGQAENKVGGADSTPLRQTVSFAFADPVFQ